MITSPVGAGEIRTVDADGSVNEVLTPSTVTDRSLESKYPKDIA
jgi:hypothetical protein